MMPVQYSTVIGARQGKKLVLEHASDALQTVRRSKLRISGVHSDNPPVGQNR